MAVDWIGDKAEREMQEPINPGDMIVVIMGMTGAGKSSFIAHCTQDRPPDIEHGLLSCIGSTQVSVHTIRMAGRTVHLIDTPGFNDSVRSDGETFQELAYWLAAAHENKLKLSGIVYLHRITDTRLHGSAHRALNIFKAICGMQDFRGVVVATTMWDGLVGDEIQKAHARQVQLEAKIHDDVIAGGGRLVALSAGAVDIRKVIGHIMTKNMGMTVAFQIEHIDQGLPLHMTGAGRIVYDNFRRFLCSEEHSADEPGSNTANVLEPFRATRGEVRAAWSARIRQEDAALDYIQQSFMEHALLCHLPCPCSCLVGSSSVALFSQDSISTSATSEVPRDHPKRTHGDGSVDQEPRCESLRLQREGDMYRRKHRLDRRHMAYGRSTTFGVVGTSIAAAQLAAAVACNVM